MMRRRLLAALLSSAAPTVASQSETATAPLMDIALSTAADLVTRGSLSKPEEEALVRRILAGDPATLLLSKHFGGLPTFEHHLRASVLTRQQEQMPPSATAESCSTESTGPSALEVLRKRRSVKKYDAATPVPSRVVDRALEAAILAPNHFLTEPWRFYLSGEETRKKLAGMNPAKAEEFASVPGWLIVTVAASEYGPDGAISTKKGLEDHAATSCAVQNFMLALAAEGVASKWMTGALGVAPEGVMELVGADQQAERFMGAIWYGYPAEPLSSDVSPPARKRGLSGVLRRLP